MRSGRPARYGFAYWAPCPGMMQPALWITWRGKTRQYDLPRCPLWPRLIIGDQAYICSDSN